MEEIEEAEAQPTVPKLPPRRKRMQEQEVVNNKPLMIGWFDKDVEFDEYLVKSLEDARAKCKREDEVACQNLEKAFAEVSSEAVASEAVASEAVSSEAVSSEAPLSDAIPSEVVPSKAPLSDAIPSEEVPSEAPLSDVIPAVSEVEVMEAVGEAVTEAVEAIPQQYQMLSNLWQMLDKLDEKTSMHTCKR